MISLNCPHCTELLSVLPSGVVVACSCEGARNEELTAKSKRTVWNAERDKVLAEERARKQRRRR